MTKSCLTEGLRSLSAQFGPQQETEQRQTPQLLSRQPNPAQVCKESTEPPCDVGLEIKAILAQEGSFTTERSSFFGCSPPIRSENGLVRDRVFGRCIPITKNQSLSPSSASAMSTA